MDELFWAMSVFLFLLFLIVPVTYTRRCRAKGADTGAVLLRLRPAGLRLLSLAWFVVLILAAVVFLLVMWEDLRPGIVRQLFALQIGFIVACDLAVFVFTALPVRVCENGLVDIAGFLPWDAVSDYKEKRPGRFLLRLKDAPRLGRLFRTVRLECPSGLGEELDAILRARVG